MVKLIVKEIKDFLMAGEGRGVGKDGSIDVLAFPKPHASRSQGRVWKERIRAGEGVGQQTQVQGYRIPGT